MRRLRAAGFLAEKTFFANRVRYKAPMTRNFIKLNCLKLLTLGCASLGLLSACVSTSPEPAKENGFAPIFDGTTMNGWRLVGKHGDGYGVKDGVIYCARGGGGNLLTEKEFADFVLRFEFKLEPGSNNGIGIRAPFEGDAAYMGMKSRCSTTRRSSMPNCNPTNITARSMASRPPGAAPSSRSVNGTWRRFPPSAATSKSPSMAR